MAGKYTVVELFARLQPNGRTCGPTALHNAILKHGERYDLRWMCEGTSRNGCDEKHLKRLAERCGYVLEHHSAHTKELAEETARNMLRRGVPFLVCVDRDKTGPYAHWISVYRGTKRNVWVCDSSLPPPVIQRLTWRDFLIRTVCLTKVDSKEWATTRWDFYPVMRKP